MINLNNQDVDKLFKTEEVILRKIKAEHVRQERKQHKQDTDLAYQEAVSLYRLQRPDHAREVFSNVEYLTPYYKSTEAFLRNIDDQELKQGSPETSKPEDTQQEIDLAQEASMIYHQSVDLGDNENTAVVKKKLTKLMRAFQQRSRQMYIRQQMARIVQEADKYDQEIFRLTQSGDYAAARKKYLEFQQAMLNDLTRVKENITRVNTRYLDAEKHRDDY